MTGPLYCRVCGEPGPARWSICPRYGCGYPQLVPKADAIAANKALGRLLTPDEDNAA